MRQKRSHNLPDKLVEFFWKRVHPGETDECWEWRTGAGTKPARYGNITLYGGQEVGLRCISAHRASWIIHNGPIESGLVIRHTCDNPCCVNPAHLIAGTQSENIRESCEKGRHKANWAFFQARKTHCPQGHLYDEANTGRSVWRGKHNRYCRACARRRARERHFKNRVSP